VKFAWWQSHMLLRVAGYASELGMPDRARTALRDLLRVAVELQDRLCLAYGLTILARLSADAGDDFTAGRWWGALEAEAEREPIGQWEQERAALEASILRATPEFAAGREAGRALTFADAVGSARSTLRSV
jgi:hypothetical protein